MFDPSFSQPTRTDFQDALNAGVWSSDFSIEPICPSGNCTFSPFRSTGWCSKCEDVTSKATLAGCHNTPFNNRSSQAQSTWCNVTLPDARSYEGRITIMPVTDAGTSDFKMRIPTHMTWSASQEFDPIDNRNMTYVGVKNPLLVLGQAELGFTFDPSGTFTAHPENGFRIDRVTECAIAMCSRMYNISVSDGIPSISTSAPDYGEVFNHGFPLAGLNASVPCWKAGHGLPADMAWMGNNGPSKSPVFQNATEFAVCPISSIASRFVDSLVSTTVVEFYYTPGYGWSLGVPPWKKSQTLQRIERAGIGHVLEGVSASLTKHALDVSNQSVYGAAAESQVYVAVKWCYLTLPAAVLGLGIIFVGITILESRGKDLSLWKMSILPALYHGLNDELLADGDERTTLSSMEKAAQFVSVKLEYSDSKNKLMLQ